jgi:hypothetical protein
MRHERVQVALDAQQFLLHQREDVGEARDGLWREQLVPAFARGAQCKRVVRRDERPGLDAGDLPVRDADEVIGAVDLNQEGRGDVAPAPDEIYVLFSLLCSD